MRTLAHISDVHFGRENPGLVRGLVEAVTAARPDVVVVSGDLTQRARLGQFAAARAFLGDLPRVPTVVVPGNHDVSMTNLVERLVRPLARYRQYISRDLAPFVMDEEVAVAGIDTTRVLSRKDGRINRRQVACACERLSEAGAERVRVVVTHHPMDLPLEDVRNALVARSAMAMEGFAGCRVDLFLSGHLHTGQTVVTSRRYGIAGWSAVVAQAGTAVSTRTRGEANSWNLIRVRAAEMAIQQMVCEAGDGAFREGAKEVFRKGESGWVLHQG